ncbi:hypothetical protein CVT25_015908 [Psilocybe cyanescens]|uniref:Hydrophobin n=1 Tax=Psilocybe cyanescens TaxID=93625 RepID=A0A409WSB9_PSICY|nr:hypothetical protein CVT25_015908 [Psilocybe cyanescens]
MKFTSAIALVLATLPFMVVMAATDADAADCVIFCCDAVFQGVLPSGNTGINCSPNDVDCVQSGRFLACCENNNRRRRSVEAQGLSNLVHATPPARPHHTRPSPPGVLPSHVDTLEGVEACRNVVDAERSVEVEERRSYEDIVRSVDTARTLCPSEVEAISKNGVSDALC